MEKLKKNWPMVLLLLAIAGCMFILNISTLISPDDYSYAYSIAGEDLKITSFSEFLNSAKSIYMGWTGRVIPHLLVGIFMTTSLLPLKIINCVLFLMLLIYIAKFITRKNSFLALILAFGFFVYGKMFGEKFTWICGSLNYLWTTTFLVIYLYHIYGYFVEGKTLTKWQKIILTLGGFIIGFSHEVTSFVGGAFLGILFLANIRKVWKSTKSDKLFFITSILLFGIGSILTITAHGNVVRSTLDGGSDGSPLACLGNYRDIKLQLLITAISMIAIYCLKQRELLKKQILYFLLPCAIATVPFSIMGYFPPRCFVPYEALIIIVAGTNVQVICEHFKEYKKSLVAVSLIVTIVVFARMLPNTYSAVRYILPYKIKVTKQLEEAKAKGEKDVVVSRFLFLDKIHREDFINIDNFFIDFSTGHGVNVYLSLYYKFDRIRAISDIDYVVEIDTDIMENVDYGIINKDTLELISVVTASDKICFAIPKAQYGTYVVDCRDKDLRSHVQSVRIRGVGEEMENPDLEKLINQES